MITPALKMAAAAYLRPDADVPAGPAEPLHDALVAAGYPAIAQYHFTNLNERGQPCPGYGCTVLAVVLHDDEPGMVLEEQRCRALNQLLAQQTDGLP